MEGGRTVIFVETRAIRPQEEKRGAIEKLNKKNKTVDLVILPADMALKQAISEFRAGFCKGASEVILVYDGSLGSVLLKGIGNYFREGRKEVKECFLVLKDQGWVVEE
ncbi:MAG: hypothetical protein ABIC19_01795 [Patescibacteria group bacterium]|nr:hypothetical protein [Patescibacteria group bacterium]